MYKTLADMACKRITAGITRAQFLGERPIKALLDPYNPVGSTTHVNFNTSKTDRWETDARRCHLNWVILDSDWEAEFCRVAEAHPRVGPMSRTTTWASRCPTATAPRCAVPARLHRAGRRRPRRGGPAAPVVEIKGYRGEDAKEKKATMETYWVPGVNNLGHLWPLGLRRVHRCLPDRGRLQGQGRKRVQQDDRRAAQPGPTGAASMAKPHGKKPRRRPSKTLKHDEAKRRTSPPPSTSP
jgi:hypothetical protein